VTGRTARRPAAGASATALLESDLPGGGSWRVTFCWSGDRFEHHLDWVDEAPPAGDLGRLQVARGIEAGEDAAWPSSPPLQQLDECPLADGRRGLVGLGMAGTSHWSLAVEAQRGQLWFDVACRVHQASGRLQSSYELSSAGSRVDLPGDAAGIVLAQRPGGVSLQMHPDARSTELVLAAGGRHVLLRPKHQPDGLPGTVRWRYGFVATA
jgi:hypothetical protein